MTDQPQPTSQPHSTGLWAERSDLAQTSLDLLYGTTGEQFLNNANPVGANENFNYWWLAHVIDVRIDAYERSGDQVWLERARATHENITARNGGDVINDYFDDMLWYALALLRLAEHTNDQEVLAVVNRLWQHIVTTGWNDIEGPSLSWRVQQPYYKNTPANGPLIILGCRLHRLNAATGQGPDDTLEWARRSMDWLEQTLVGPDGFVEDGINRQNDQRVDTQWRFTYNQGLYIGAGVEMYRVTGDESWLERAEKTALTAISQLATDGVFQNESEGEGGGDVGLFKGIYYRYADQLLLVRSVAGVEDFIRSSSDALWSNQLIEGAQPVLRAGDDWTGPAPETVEYSTQLSAIMATEMRARLEVRTLES